MEWVALGIVTVWFWLIQWRCNKIEVALDRVERIQGRQLHREALRDPPLRL